MSEKPKSIWTKPWTGKGTVVAWFGLAAGAVFIITFFIDLAAGNSHRTSDSLQNSLAIAGIFAVGSAVLFWLYRLTCWLCVWRNLRRFLFGAACLVTLIALLWAQENWRGKRAWEKHRAGLEAQGETFSLKELAPPPVPDDQNFAMSPLLKPACDFVHGPDGAVIWRDTNGLARLEAIRADIPVSRKSDGIVRGNLDKGAFADLEKCREFYRGNTNYPQPDVPGRAAADILFALGRFDSEIKELHESAAARPHSRFPIEYDYEPPWAILLPHLRTIKELCVLIEMRVLARLELGLSAEAMQELRLGFRLSDAISNEPLLIDHLVRIATVAINLQTVREGLLRHAWTDAQLNELEKHLSSLNLLAEYKLGIRGERALSTGGLNWLRRQGFRSDVMHYIADDSGASGIAPALNLMPSGWYYQNMLTVSKMEQEFTLAAVDPKAHRVFPETVARSTAAIEQMGTTPYTVFVKMLLPALEKSVQKSARMQFYVDAARVACALERYRLANGKLPEKLTALTQKFIAAIPNDVIDGKPIRYHLNSDGSYKLYSIGWNQTDDGGEIALTKPGSKSAPVDVAKGDWVWQMPAGR